MLKNTSLKFAGLALGLMLVAGCQHQGTGQSSDAANAKKSAEVAASTSAKSQTSNAQQSAEQAGQSLIAVHLAQRKSEPELLTLDLGEGKKLYALPQPVLTQSDMEGVASVASEDGKTFLMFNMSEQGRAKLAKISTEARGHFLLFSVKNQLVGIAQVDQPVTDGKLVMATENAEHTKQILQLMQ